MSVALRTIFPTSLAVFATSVSTSIPIAACRRNWSLAMFQTVDTDALGVRIDFMIAKGRSRMRDHPEPSSSPSGPATIDEGHTQRDRRDESDVW